MIDALIHTHGSISQRERFITGRLPEDELKKLARDVIFRAIDAPAYRRIKDVHHTDDCWRESQANRNWPDVSFRVDEHYLGPLNERQWLTWKQIEMMLRSFPPLGMERQLESKSVNIRRHVGTCARCGAEKSRLSVLVSASFSGLELSKEYAL